MKLFLVCIVLLSLYCNTEAGKCDMKYKNVKSGTHTACLSPSPNLVNTIPIKGGDRKKILDAHNDFRKAEDATNMLKMTWDNELAMLAEKWTETCPNGHDKGPLREAIGRFKSGQNIYHTSSPKLSFADGVKAWADEKNDFTFGGTMAQQTGVVGHYTQVVWAETFKVGCAAAKCKNVKYPTVFVCNYGPGGNMKPNQYKPYEAGKDCSACPGKCKDGLCDCGGKLCYNDGTMDLATCQCNCYKNFKWYKPGNCQLNCAKAKDMSFCPQYGKKACDIFSNVPHECPVMCGRC